ncbi:MAG: hypothetical protein LBN39_06005 [Planctomycetaceae bacterium]|jgi:hypothetical protein|nr:hypothetical protein [Planctomycetaceae bacterium]
MPPAPFWFVEFFKVVGFVLHLIPMGLWFAGLPAAILCASANTVNSRRFAGQMFGQLPILMALGINFGIVPLLFLQTTYYKSFYTATILMGWHWIAVIPILLVGYYALYIAQGVGRQESRRAGGQIFFAVLAAICFVSIGILMTNGLTLMVRSDLWTGLMEKYNVHGATLGLGNNMKDPAVWIRLTTMFSLGLMTTAVWAVLSVPFTGSGLSGNSKKDYCFWTGKLAAVLAILSAVLLTGVESIIKTPFAAEHIKIMYPYFGVVLLFVYGTAIFLIAANWKPVWFYAGVVSHVLTLANFGIIRQIGQNRGVAAFVDVAKLPTDVQWSPLIAFLVAFVLGLGIIAWMVKQVIFPPVNADNGRYAKVT